MKKKSKGKLALGKITVSRLNTEEMGGINGGGCSDEDPMNCAYTSNCHSMACASRDPGDPNCLSHLFPSVCPPPI